MSEHNPSLTAQVLEASSSLTSGIPAPGMLVGRVIAFNEAGSPLVAFDAETQEYPIEAMTTVPLDVSSIGKDVVISFAQNQPDKPIVMGLIRRLMDDVLEAPLLSKEQQNELSTENQNELSTEDQSVLSNEGQTERPSETVESQNVLDKPEVVVDGRKLELSAPEEVTIRCGKASITLNKSGKILIKGDHLLNRVSGAYKIKSGSIELN